MHNPVIQPTIFSHAHSTKMFASLLKYAVNHRGTAFGLCKFSFSKNKERCSTGAFHLRVISANYQFCNSQVSTS